MNEERVFNLKGIGPGDPAYDAMNRVFGGIAGNTNTMDSYNDILTRSKAEQQARYDYYYQLEMNKLKGTTLD